MTGALCGWDHTTKPSLDLHPNHENRRVRFQNVDLCVAIGRCERMELEMQRMDDEKKRLAEHLELVKKSSDSWSAKAEATTPIQY